MAKHREDESRPKADERTVHQELSGTEPETTTIRPEAAETIGGTIGPYKLLDELGAGGMGTVYLAEQDRPVRRRVALKVIKAGLDTGQVIARFEAERQALALMDQTNIARVLDAGTTDSGRPYFVMELVQGVPITSYCDSHRVPIRERLDLFLPVCRAVQHAHQKGIIHRDLKPSNILVTLRDDQPVAKIIDFGIAKATTQRLTDRTLYTQYGTLVGTPDYMSPEQAGMGGLDVDTRSDVYSLGAVLYELLCGDTPLGRHRLKDLDFVSMLGVIYEDEPPTPSRHISESGDGVTEVARRRDTEPHKLIQSLYGELDWIATKALEKDRTRRYESASALAADIERHLNNEPVEASPPSATYRLQKFVRRNRAPLAAAAAIALVLIGGIIVSGWQAYRATQAEHEMGIERQAALSAKADAERLLGKVQRSEKLAEGRRVDAENAKRLAEAAVAKESEARKEIEKRLREADAMRLAMQSRDAGKQYPQRALLLAAEAVETTLRKNEPIMPAAHQALVDALETIGGRPLPGYQNPAIFAETTPDGHWLFTGDGASTLRWDLSADDPAETSVSVGPPSMFHRAMAISPDGQWLATMSVAHPVIQLWDIHAEKLERPVRELELAPQQSPNEVLFSGDGRLLAARSWQTAWFWDLTDERESGAPILLEAEGTTFSRLLIGASNRWAVSTDGSQQTGMLWNLADTNQPPRPLHRDRLDHSSRAEISADGRWLAAAQTDGRTHSLRVWDLKSDDPLQSVRKVPLSERFYGGMVYRFTPDGRYLATTSLREVALWDLSDEKWEAPQKTLSTQQTNEMFAARPMSALVGEQNRGLLLGVNSDGTIFRWDLDSTDPQASRAVVGGHPGSGNVSLTLSGSGRWLVTTRHEESPRLWDLWGRSGKINGMALDGHDNGVSGIVIGGGTGWRGTAACAASDPLLRAKSGAAPAGNGERWLITRGSNSKPRLWDLHAEDPARAGLRTGARRFKGNNVARRADGRWVILKPPSSVQIVDPNHDKPVSTTHVGTASLSFNWSSGDVPLSSDGRWLAINEGNEISIWSLEKEEAKPRRSESAGGELLQRLWRLPLGLNRSTADKPYKTIRAEPNWLFGEIRIGPDGHWLLARANGWHAWNLQAAESAAAIELDRQAYAPTFSPDGKWVATYLSQSSRGSISLWNLTADPPRRTNIELSDQYFGGHDALAFSADGRWLAAGGRQVRLWELGEEGALGEPFALGEFQTTFQVVALSHDGRRVAAVAEHTVHLWDRAAQEPARQHQVLRGHEQAIRTMEFSPDDQWLVTASDGGDVRLWNLSAGQTQETMIVLDMTDENRFSPRSSFVFGPDGQWLVANNDQNIIFFPLDPARRLEDARRLAGRQLTSEEAQRYRLNVAEVMRGGLVRQAAEIAERIKKSPQDSTLVEQRARLLACAGQFGEAIDEMRLLIRLKPDDHWPQYQLLSLLAQDGQDEAYRRLCESMAKQFAETDQIEILERVAKGSLFWERSSADWKKVAPSAALALKKATESNHWVVPWAQIAKGLAEYRLHDYAAALDWAEKGLSHNSTAYSVVVPGNQLKAMALARLGEMDAARAALDAAKKAHAAAPQPLQGWFEGWNDWYMYEILFREAEAVLLAKSSPELGATDTQSASDESPPGPSSPPEPSNARGPTSDSGK